MIKQFVRHGESWALVIDPDLLNDLKIDPSQPLQVVSDGHRA
jgi:hypothetical protein